MNSLAEAKFKAVWHHLDMVNRFARSSKEGGREDLYTSNPILPIHMVGLLLVFDFVPECFVAVQTLIDCDVILQSHLSSHY